MPVMDDPFDGLYNDPYAVLRIKKSIEALDIKPGMSVLDVGCYKEFAKQFLPEGVKYVGIDKIKGDQIDGGFRLHQKFDRIICLEVLEHLQYPRKTLASIASHLATSGICVISLPNEATLFHRLRGLFGLMDAEAFGESCKHLHLPSLKQARSFVQSCFHVTQEFYYISPQAQNSRQAWVGKILKLAPDKLWIFLAYSWPSLFARGFIFVCKHK